MHLTISRDTPTSVPWNRVCSCGTSELLKRTKLAALTGLSSCYRTLSATNGVGAGAGASACNCAGICACAGARVVSFHFISFHFTSFHFISFREGCPSTKLFFKEPSIKNNYSTIQSKK